MANSNTDLQEVQRAIGRLEGKVEEGFRGVHKRQDITNGNLQDNSERISDLEEHVDWSEVRRNQEKIETMEAFINNLKGRLATYAVLGGAVISLILFGIQEGLKVLFQ